MAGKPTDSPITSALTVALAVWLRDPVVQTHSSYNQSSLSSQASSSRAIPHTGDHTTAAKQPTVRSRPRASDRPVGFVRPPVRPAPHAAPRTFTEREPSCTRYAGLVAQRTTTPGSRCPRSPQVWLGRSTRVQILHSRRRSQRRRNQPELLSLQSALATLRPCRPWLRAQTPRHRQLKPSLWRSLIET